MRRVPLWRPRRHAIAWMWSHWSLKCDAIGGRLKAASSSQLKTQNTDAQKCQKMQNCCPTVSQLDPNWIHRSARNHSRTAFASIFPCPDPPWPLCSFSAHQYHPIPPLLHQNGKSSLKPNGSSTRYNGNLPSGVKKIALMKIPSKWMSLAGKASN